MNNKTTIAYEVFSICYDTDYGVNENDLDLPRHLIIEVPTDEEDIESYLGDVITEKSGFCIYQFDYQPYKQN